MNLLRFLRLRLRLHLPLNIVFFCYCLLLYLLVPITVFLPISPVGKGWILGLSLALLVIPIALAEISFLMKTRMLRAYFRNLPRSTWSTALLVSLILTGFELCQKTGWFVAIVIGIAVGFGAPLHGYLFGHEYPAALAVPSHKVEIKQALNFGLLSENTEPESPVPS
jgi:hypothetical protein